MTQPSLPLSVTSPTPAVVNLGTCWGMPQGQDLSSPSYMATGFQCVGEAIARRWSTSQGQLIDDPDYGLNVTDQIGNDLTPGEVAQMQQQLGAEAEKDERVVSCTCVVTFTNGALSVHAAVVTAAGPFKLVLGVSQVAPATLLVTP